MSSRAPTLMEMKLRSQAREDEEADRAKRRRNILVLILDHLTRHGYVEACERLQAESGVSLSQVEAADNMDLTSIVKEFENYYSLKYGREPKLSRRTTITESTETKKQKAAAGRRQAAATAIATGTPVPSSAPTSGASSPVPPSSSSSSTSAMAGRRSASGSTKNPGASAPSASSGSKTDDDINKAPSASSKPPLAGRRGANGTNNTSASKKGSMDASPDFDGGVVGTSATGANGNVGVHGSALPIAGGGRPSRHLAAYSNHGMASSALPNAAAYSVPTSYGGADRLSAGAPNATSGSGATSASSSTPIAPSKRAAPARGNASSSSGVDDEGQPFEFFEHRLLKPMPHFPSGQLRELAEVITRDIYMDNPNVRWTDIAELHEAKQLLKEAVVMPLKFPQFFTGLLSPWKGVLLYGPPGTGKTMLARAVATECRTTFFNISASSIVSKYRGDSEKLVRVLFDLARHHSPSTIFIDEMDSIMGSRDAAGEHEGSRRMKTELLVQMDGLAKSSDIVFVLAASNIPWDLDMAILRRLEKRILVPLPNDKARKSIFEFHLPDGERASGLDYRGLGVRTEGYSGADIVSLCKEAAMRPVRRLMARINAADSASEDPDLSEVKLDPVTREDLDAAIACVRPSAAPKFLARYDKWASEFGSGYSAPDDINTATSSPSTSSTK